MAGLLDLDRFSSLRERREAWDSLFSERMDDACAKTSEETRRSLRSADADLAAFVALYLINGEYADAYVRNRAGVSPVNRLLSDVSKELGELYSLHEETALNALSDMASETYLRACYELQWDMGDFHSVRTLSERELSELANREWFDGGRFSDRLWADKDALYRNLYRTLTEGIANGEGLKDMSERMAKSYSHGEYVVERLIRTEMNRVMNQALMRAYSENGVERYEYIAILDERTTETCEGLNGQTFRVADAEPGVNMPPMHVNCRSSTAPVYDGRSKADSDSDRLDYESWYREYVKK